MCFLLVYKNAIDFYVDLISCSFAKLTYYPRNCFRFVLFLDVIRPLCQLQTEIHLCLFILYVFYFLLPFCATQGFRYCTEHKELIQTPFPCSQS